MVTQIIALIPWATLIEKAPQLIDGAVRLYHSVGKSRIRIPATINLASASHELDAEKLTTTVRALEAALTTLNAQMAEASLLIEDLATANRSLAIAGRRYKIWLIALSAMTAASIVASMTTLLR